MAQHPAIDRWAMKKFPEANFPEGTTFRIEGGTEWSGYCDTCRYEEQIVKVFAKQPMKDAKEYLHDTLYTHLAEIMTEILDAAMETK